MNPAPSNSKTIVGMLIALALVGVGWGVWFATRPPQQPAAPPAGPPKHAEAPLAPQPIVEQFYTGVAALDVQDNDRAVAVFTELSEKAADEPAVWANLGVARSRLNDSEAALQAVRKAAKMAPVSVEIALVEARLLEQAGEFEPALQALERVPDDNIEALHLKARIAGRSGVDGASATRLALIAKVLDRRPDNLVARFEQAKLAARTENGPLLDEALDRLASERPTWSEIATEQFDAAKKAAAEKNFKQAETQITFLENLSKPGPRYQQALEALGVTGNIVAESVPHFVKLREPEAAAADPDMRLTFDVQPTPEGNADVKWAEALTLATEPSATLAWITNGKLKLDTGAELDFPGVPAEGSLGDASVQTADVNYDFREDLLLAGSGGCAIYLQGEHGGFTRWEPAGDAAAQFQQPADGVWAFDVEADGDLDLLLSRGEGQPQLLRNNGDMTFTAAENLKDLPPLRQLLWIDFDNDGDVDIAVLDREGRALVFWNERGGLYRAPVEPLGNIRAAAIAAGNVNQEGRVDLAALGVDGGIHIASPPTQGDVWNVGQWTRWKDSPHLADAMRKNRASLHLADLDNNGVLDLVAAADGKSAVWLGFRNPLLHPGPPREYRDRFKGSTPNEFEYQQLAASPEMSITSAVDLDADGLLDLAGVASDGVRIASNLSERGYHWQTFALRANTGAGDKRFNSFGIGGRVEIRAGRLVQAVPIDASRIHVGLGQNERMGLARIVWPNGTVQAEYECPADHAIVSEQRLDTSCPFVFAYDGRGFAFVKDFIWRSPLGLRINAQDTTGVAQTEDWIKIPGDTLVERDGVYELRITAELWETHFFDTVRLAAIDHPEDVEVFVDERFIARQSPELKNVTTTEPRAIGSAHDEHGNTVTDRLAAIDGRYVDSFALGWFQGIAEEHWVEFELERGLPEDRPLFLVGHGWVYPTDSSLNVAMSQGSFPQPFGVNLEVLEADGTWRVAAADLGFPAGKNKTVLFPLPAPLAADGKRLRLRTNLEVYWDFLGWAAADESVEPRTIPLKTVSAELRFRGFSAMSAHDRRKPDIPRYDALAGVGQRWRDLEGHYTRFGDVRELLAATDDRYVIMNAGDEIVLRFAVPGPVEEGKRRDFVLIGDGWVKDGDYNTSYSKTVAPLPSHGDPDYAGPAVPLSDDPVFRLHRDDWRTFHTRYVNARQFERGLLRGAAATNRDPQSHSDSFSSTPRN